MEEEADFEINDYIYVPNIKDTLNGDMKSIKAYVISDEIKEINLSISYLTDVEKDEINDYIYVPNIKDTLNGDMKSIKAYVISDEIKEINLSISYLTDVEKEIIKAGCLINYNKK